VRLNPTQGEHRSHCRTISTTLEIRGKQMSRARLRSIGFLLGLGLLIGCGHIGTFVWVDAYKEPPPATRSGYVISRGDLISIRVWNQDGMSVKSRVRGDGMVSMPFLNDVEVAGYEPAAVAKRLQTKLKDFIVNPVVTFSLEEQAPFEVSVIGEVAKPGAYRLEQDTGVLKALATAGGLSQIAGRDRIFVLRYGEGQDPRVPLRIRFTYRSLTQAEGNAARFRLRSGDVVVVE
jgi:polysaccharide biosynthesis/export protein